MTLYSAPPSLPLVSCHLYSEPRILPTKSFSLVPGIIFRHYLPSLYPAKYILPIVSYPLYPAHCILPIASCQLYPVHCILPIVSCPLYPANCILPIVSCPLYPAHCILPMVTFLLYPVHYILPPTPPPAGCPLVCGADPATAARNSLEPGAGVAVVGKTNRSGQE